MHMTTSVMINNPEAKAGLAQAARAPQDGGAGRRQRGVEQGWRTGLLTERDCRPVGRWFTAGKVCAQVPRSEKAIILGRRDVFGDGVPRLYESSFRDDGSVWHDECGIRSICENFRASASENWSQLSSARKRRACDIGRIIAILLPCG